MAALVRPIFEGHFQKKGDILDPYGGWEDFFLFDGQTRNFFLYLTEQNAVDWYCSSIILIKINTVRTHVTIFSFLKLDQK